jgi:hypothetical protein
MMPQATPWFPPSFPMGFGTPTAPNTNGRFGYMSPPVPLTQLPVPSAAVYSSPVPWTMSIADMAAMHAKLAAEAAAAQQSPTRVDQVDTAKASPKAAETKLAVSETGSRKKAGAKKAVKERLYSEEEFKWMAQAVLSKGRSSARQAALDAGYPSATRKLQDYIKTVKADATLMRATPADTLTARLAYVAAYEHVQKGNADLMSRRIFSGDECLYFARALKVYNDMGWPMDYQAIQLMFSQAAQKMKRVDWKPGDPYVVSRTYVTNFVKFSPELRAYKASNIDPLRSKKATASVPFVPTNIDMHMHYILYIIIPPHDPI